MTKKIISFLTIILSLACLSGCCLVHNWTDATCTTPRTCLDCGKTEGEPLGHDYIPATCTTPKKCVVCGFEEGIPLEHTWSKATCTEPVYCLECGETRDAYAEHTWIAATCVRPRYCSVCGLTEGDYAPHQWVDASFNSPRTCAMCGATEGTALKSYVSAAGDYNYSLRVGGSQDYSTITGYDNRIARGTVTVLSYDKIVTDDSHPYKEGYEWREVKVRFDMDKASRVMWGYTDSYTGLSEYARTNYITYADGTREKVEAYQSFSSVVVTPTPAPVTPSPSPTPSPEPTPTAAPTSGGSQPATSPTPPTAPQITPSPTPTPIPTPESEPGKYISYVTQSVQVPVKYDGLVFYVCNADYELDHTVDDTFLFMQMK